MHTVTVTGNSKRTFGKSWCRNCEQDNSFCDTRIWIEKSELLCESMVLKILFMIMVTVQCAHSCSFRKETIECSLLILSLILVVKSSVRY